MFKRHLLASSIQKCLWTSLAVSMAIPNALADEAKTQAEVDAAEVITVTGVRSSLRDAAFLKKSANQIMDAISSEDIGKLPDNNVAEALQRITGIQIGRDATGGGSSFQVRGLSQNRVEVNGQTMVSNGAEDRSNSFSETSSTLFKGIEVIKSPTADMTEGAIGATVRLKTFAPLDFKDDLTVSGQLQATRDESAHDLGGNDGFIASGMVSKKFELDDYGQIGILVNISQEEKITLAETYNTNWRAATKSQLVNDPDSPEKIMEQYYANTTPETPESERPTTIVYIQDQPTLERKPFEEAKTGLDAKIQWAPNANLELFAQGMRTTFVQDLKQVRLNFLTRDSKATFGDNSEYLFFTRNAIPGQFKDDQGTPADGITHRAIMSYGELNFDDAGAPIRFAGNFSSVETKQYAFSTGFKWNINDDLTTDYVFNRSESVKMNEGGGSTSYNVDVKRLRNPDSTTDGYYQPTLVMENGKGEIPSAYLDYRGLYDDPDTPEFESAPDLNSYDGLNAFTWNNFSASDNRQNAEELSHQLDFDWLVDLSVLTKIEFGVRYSTREVSRQETKQYQTGINGEGNTFDQLSNNFQSMEDSSPGIVTNFFEPMQGSILDGAGGADSTAWLIPKYSRALWDAQKELLLPGSYWRENKSYPYLVAEDVYAGYIKGNFEFDLGDFPVTGNAGLRLVRTESDTQGIGTYDGGETVTLIQEQNAYNNLLPSINFNVMLTDKMFLRLAYAGVMSRPNPIDLSPSLQVYSGTLTGQQGNPFLQPFEATQFDISYEWYLDDVTTFSSAYFHKTIDNFHRKLSFIIPGSAHCIDLDNNGVNGCDTPGDTSDDVTVRSKSNAGGGSVDGIELALQSSFDFLPGFWSGFGVQLNYTFTQSSQESGYDELTGDALPYPELSENSYNAVLFYDKYGFNFRAAYNFRDEFYKEDSAGAPDEKLWVIDEAATARAGENVYSQASAPLAIWRDAYQSLDLSASYKISKQYTVFFQVNNALDENQRDYAGVTGMTSAYYETGRKFSLGIRGRL